MTGTVTFYDETSSPSTTLGVVPVSNNSAQFSSINLGYVYGERSIVAQYSGDANNTPAESSAFTFLQSNPLAMGSSPAVSITSPAAGAIINGLSDVIAQTSVGPNAQGATTYPIVSVEYVLNGSVAGTATSTPYTVTLVDLPVGSYSLTAYAVDTQGTYWPSPPVAFTVAAAAATAPVVSLVSPLTSTQITTASSVTLVAKVSASSGRTISSVSFFANGTTALGTVSSAPYTLTAPAFAEGGYELTAIATDNTGATGTSSVVILNVVASDTPPSETVNYIHSDLGGSPIAATDPMATSSGERLTGHSVSALTTSPTPIPTGSSSISNLPIQNQASLTFARATTILSSVASWVQIRAALMRGKSRRLVGTLPR